MPALSNSVSGGLIPIRQMTGAELGKANEYEAIAGYGTGLFVGDPLIFVNTSNTTDGTPQVQATTEDGTVLLLGAMVAAKPVLTNLTLNYRPLSTLQKILVADDPMTVFRIQSDGTSASTDVYKYAGFSTAVAGSTTTGQSGFLIDAETITGTAATNVPIKILRSSNTLGDTLNNATSGSVYDVIIINHVWNT